MTTIASTSEIPDVQVSEHSQPPAPTTMRRRWEWIGLLPFLLFVLIFQLFPALSIVVRSFLSQSNQFTFANIEALNNPVIIQSFSSSLQVAFLSALTGCMMGFALAWAITWGGMSPGIRSAVLSFCGVAANFAGVPLVFAFVSAYGLTGLLTGRQGIITQMLASLGISLYPGFTIYNFWGLVVVYLFFQLPLMVLIVFPALAGLKREWREASENLGASRWQYWRFVAMPILIPSILSAFALLFANAFGTHATAVALIGGGAGQNLAVTILVGNQFSSDTMFNPGLGYSLALVMVIIMAFTIFLNGYFRRRAERWLRP